MTTDDLVEEDLTRPSLIRRLLRSTLSLIYATGSHLGVLRLVSTVLRRLLLLRIDVERADLLRATIDRIISILNIRVF